LLEFTTLVCLRIQRVRHAKVYLPLAAPTVYAPWRATRAVNSNLTSKFERCIFAMPLLIFSHFMRITYKQRIMKQICFKHDSYGLKCFMKSVKTLKRGDESGQTATEYSIMLLMFMLVGVIMLLLITALNSYGWRILSLVGLDYP
jgi:hypothetical protein